MMWVDISAAVGLACILLSYWQVATVGPRIFDFTNALFFPFLASAAYMHTNYVGMAASLAFGFIALYRFIRE